MKFWDLKPKKSKGVKFKAPYKPNKSTSQLKEVQFFKSKKTPKKQMNWAQARKYHKLSPFKDYDKDKVPNFMDCRPFNSKMHDTLPRYRRKSYRKYLPEMKELYGRVSLSEKEMDKLRKKYATKSPTGRKRLISKMVKEDLAQVIPPTIDSFSVGGIPMGRRPRWPTEEEPRPKMTLAESTTKFDKRLILERVGKKKKKKVVGALATIPTTEKGTREIDTIYIEPERRGRGYSVKAIRNYLKDPRIKRLISKRIIHSDRDVKRTYGGLAKKIPEEEYKRLTYTKEPDDYGEVPLPEEEGEQLKDISDYYEYKDDDIAEEQEKFVEEDKD